MTLLAHNVDPITSDLAAESLKARDLRRTRDAILELLAEEPRAVFELTEAYFNLREVNDWPNCKRDGVAKRTSDLHRDGFITESELPPRESPYGRLATVWQIAR